MPFEPPVVELPRPPLVAEPPWPPLVAEPPWPALVAELPLLPLVAVLPLPPLVAVLGPRLVLAPRLGICGGSDPPPQAASTMMAVAARIANAPDRRYVVVLSRLQDPDLGLVCSGLVEPMGRSCTKRGVTRRSHV